MRARTSLASVVVAAALVLAGTAAHAWAPYDDDRTIADSITCNTWNRAWVQLNANYSFSGNIGSKYFSGSTGATHKTYRFTASTYQASWLAYPTDRFMSFDMRYTGGYCS